jgi:hypothetical protein
MGPNKNYLISFEKFSAWYIPYFTAVGSKRSAEAGDDSTGVATTAAKKPKQPSKKAATANSSSSTDPVAAGPSAASASTGVATTSLPAARRNALLKAIVTSLKSAIKSKKWYSNDGDLEECTGETVMMEEEFKSIFSSVGNLLAEVGKDGQEKKSSVVTNKTLRKDDLTSIFGTQLDGISVSTYNKPRNFQKQYKTGKANLVVSSAHLNYSKNTQTCKIKFSLHCSGSYGGLMDVIYGRNYNADY